MSIGTSPSVQVPPTVPAATGKKGREPWYYGYCYRMTLILLTLSILGIVVQAVVGFGITTLVFMPERYGGEVGQFPALGPHPAETGGGAWAREAAWTVSNVMLVFWSILAVLWMFYVFGFALIFIDVARWARRYYVQGVRT
jgi:hypothetical protein